jgi:hypothetical protein
MVAPDSLESHDRAQEPGGSLMRRSVLSKLSLAGLMLLMAPLLSACLVSDDDLYRGAPVSAWIEDGRYDVQTKTQDGSFVLKDRITVEARDNVAGVARDENGDFFVLTIHDIGDGLYIAANEVTGLNFRYMLLRPNEDATLVWSLECFAIQELGLQDKYAIEADVFDCSVADRETLEAVAREFAQVQEPDFRVVPSAE